MQVSDYINRQCSPRTRAIAIKRSEPSDTMGYKSSSRPSLAAIASRNPPNSSHRPSQRTRYNLSDTRNADATVARTSQSRLQEMESDTRSRSARSSVCGDNTRIEVFAAQHRRQLEVARSGEWEACDFGNTDMPLQALGTFVPPEVPSPGPKKKRIVKGRENTNKNPEKANVEEVLADPVSKVSSRSSDSGYSSGTENRGRGRIRTPSEHLGRGSDRREQPSSASSTVTSRKTQGRRLLSSRQSNDRSPLPELLINTPVPTFEAGELEGAGSSIPIQQRRRIVKVTFDEEGNKVRKYEEGEPKYAQLPVDDERAGEEWSAMGTEEDAVIMRGNIVPRFRKPKTIRDSRGVEWKGNVEALRQRQTLEQNDLKAFRV